MGDSIGLEELIRKDPVQTTIAMITQRYFDVLPLRDQPKPLESFTSYLTRLAELNGIHSITALAATCFPDQTLNVVRNLRDYPLPEMENLETVATCSEADLLATTFYHLGKKFKRSILSRSLSAFLAGSLAEYLRYCPVCIADQGYYSLAWRFPLLQGCHKHSCKLLDACAYCHQPIPILRLLSPIGVCPHCKSDLRRCLSQPLSREESSLAHETFRELEFLLTPQTWETNDIVSDIGSYYAYLRQEKRLTMEAVCDSLKKNVRCLVAVELAPVEIGGTSFQTYLDYARHLDVTLHDIFNHVLSGAVSSMIRRQKHLPDESELIEKMRVAAEILRTRGESITQTAISRVAKISPYHLFRYHSTKVNFEQLTGKSRVVGRTAHLRASRVFEDVQKALKYLEEIGEPATTRRVGKLVGVDPTYFKYHPHLNVLLKESAEKTRSSNHIKNIQRKEEELLIKVQNAIQELEESNQPVTQRAIGRIVGKRPDKLKTYPLIKDLLQQRAYWPQRQKEQSLCREDDLMLRIEAALQQLEESGQRKTLSALGQIVGIDPDLFKFYPRVRELLMQRVDTYRERFERLALQKEMALLAKVEEAIELLNKLGQPVTQQAVSRLIKAPAAHFYVYPRVKSLFEQRVDQYYQYQTEQGKQHEDELLVTVEEAIELLRNSGHSITQQNISNMVGKSQDTLLRFPRVKALLLQYTKAQQSYRRTLTKSQGSKYIDKVNKKTIQSEEELLAKVKVVMQQLESSQQKVSIRAICVAVGISQSYLYSWPSIISTVQEFIQRTNSRVLELRFQQREEELVQSVLVAIAQLQSDGQRVSVGAITRVVHLSQAALYRYPKVRVVLEDIAKRRQHRKVVEPS